MYNLKNIIKHSKKLKLLYVEDNKEARNSTALILEEFFDNIVLAENGEDGYSKFKENEIDLIITDINMPKLNGLEMIEKINKIDRDTPTIVLSAHNESKFLVESIELGVSNFIFKPVDINRLCSVLELVLEKIILKNEAKANLQLLNEYHDIIDKSSIVSKTDLDGIITYVNDEFCKISGYTRDELIGGTHKIVGHIDSISSAYIELRGSTKDEKSIWKGMLKNFSKNKKDYFVDCIIKPIVNSDGVITEYISVEYDITQRITLHKKLEELHLYDTQQQQIAKEKLEVGIVNHLHEDDAKVIYAPLDIMSGDFYSIFTLRDNSKFIYIIDGQGHGISPSLTVFSISSTIYNLIDKVSELQELVDDVFPTIQLFLGEIEQLSYTMIMISADGKTISYSAGGMYPFLIKKDSDVQRVKSNNMPFMNFSQTPMVTTLQNCSWDSLLLYSDGLVEHRDAKLEKFTPESILQDATLMDEMQGMVKSADLEDDLTTIFIKNFQ